MATNDPEACPPPRDLMDHVRNLRYDLPAGLVVFLVALPLCLGIAVASGVPPLAGLVTGMVGGILVAWVSGSHVAVTGPAAGLIAVVLTAVETVGYSGLLLATSIAGVVQIGFGIARLGGLSRLFPSSVIQGMLVGIGLIIILKEIPVALGGELSFSGVGALLGSIHWGALILTVAGLGVIQLDARIERLKQITWLPGPLLAVVVCVLLNELLGVVAPSLALGGEALVQIPSDQPWSALAAPDFSMVAEPVVWTTAVTIALIASVETLLCVEALDSLDQFKRKTPTNRELIAQGTGNAAVGFLGGLPMTALIVRGSTNVQAGSRTRVSSFTHGVLLLGAVVVLTPLINRVPLAALAAVLLHVGFKLAHPRLIASMVRRAPAHWVPFVTTAGLVWGVDLLTGVLVGFGVSIAFILADALRVRQSASNGQVKVRIGPNIPWLSRFVFRSSLRNVSNGAVVEIDGSDADPVHDDFEREIARFVENAVDDDVDVRVRSLPNVVPVDNSE